MEMFLMAAVALAGALLYFVCQKGWSTVKAYLQSRAQQAEKVLGAEVSKVFGPKLAQLEADIAALKAKVGM